MKKYKIILILIILILSGVNLQAKEVITLNLDKMVRQVLENPPTSSRLSMLYLELTKPNENITGMLLPKVNLKVNETIGDLNDLSYQCILSGDLSDFLLTKKRIKYQQLLLQKHYLDLTNAKKELVLSFVYPYLMIVEVDQNKKILAKIKDNNEKYFKFIEEKGTLGQIDPLLYKMAKLTNYKFRNLCEEQEREYTSLQKELMYLLNYEDTADLQLVILEDLFKVQKQYDLEGYWTQKVLDEIVAKHPEVQAEKIEIEINKLSKEIDDLNKKVPDLQYNLQISYNHQTGYMWNWNVSTIWEWDSLLNGTRLNLSVNQTNRQINFSLNERQGHNSVNVDHKKLILASENNLKTKKYLVENKYRKIINNLISTEKMLEIIKQNKEIIEEQLRQVEQMPESVQKYLDLMELNLEYATVCISYNSQFRNYLYSQFQLKLASDQIKFW
ncbi:hypothetical protein BBF96_11485 [Anoxybacter fermentans]|uniref:Outer membrane efflux protein n=1 Tax=Anoxybacter fermentans TaxID=1323375 RepID=A0A3S9T078_9FIRM|nr:hypothetical protein [Anoxybacter fermentans]AZR73958.1 hypothetical protein BBF96_11485 [Anoxybacter fermentans]